MEIKPKPERDTAEFNRTMLKARVDPGTVDFLADVRAQAVSIIASIDELLAKIAAFNSLEHQSKLQVTLPKSQPSQQGRESSS